MPRLTDESIQPIYAAAASFVRSALQSDDSLFTPGHAVWTLDNLRDFRSRFTENPDESATDFETKFKKQLVGAPAETIQLAGEVLFVHFLASKAVGFDSKRSLIERVLAWSPTVVSIPESLLHALKDGIANPGMSFNTRRPFLLSYVIDFAIAWKRLPASEREALLKDPWAYKSFVFSIEGKGVQTQQHALLHLLHPEAFEPITSQYMKRDIARGLAEPDSAGVEDVDRRILMIRDRLNGSLGEGFNFYDPRIKGKWHKGEAAEEAGTVATEDVLRDLGDEASSSGASAEEVRAIVERMVPDAETRKVILEALAESACVAHEVNPASWILSAPNQSRGGLRLSAGRDWLVALLGVEVAVSYRMSVLSPDAQRELASLGPEPFSDDDLMRVRVPIAEFPRLWGLLKSACHAAARVAAAWGRRTPFARYHSQGALEYLRSETAIDIPDPASVATVTKGADSGAASTAPAMAAALPLNLILYGPPGTGKTYLTAELAVQICDGDSPPTHAALMDRYRELRNLRRIRFVTFHPSFTYEEFVEGIRPVMQDGQVRYEVRPGVFRQAVTHARELYESPQSSGTAVDLAGRKLFKMSLGNKKERDEDWIYEDCIEQGYVCHDYGAHVDFSGCGDFEQVRQRYLSRMPAASGADFAISAVARLMFDIADGDLVLISDGNLRFRAIGEVVGPYEFRDREEGYCQRRPVRWLWRSAESVPVEMLLTKRLSQMSLYRVDEDLLKPNALKELLAPAKADGRVPNCVLVIDEINRANLAKTFGELITLIEPSKRLGQSDEQVAELPYSGGTLCVPPNLYLLGTMNTADRSIALMDTALRRRFEFREMAPDASLLSTDMDGIDLRRLLEAMNARIEEIFDRDHVLGHTYLMRLQTFDHLVARFRSQIIPLLQEYFFEDWRRIQEVFNDVGRPVAQQLITATAPQQGEGRRGNSGTRYRVNDTISRAAIEKIYS